VAGGRPSLPAVGGRSAPSVRRSWRPTDPPSARRTSVGSSDASGRPADAAVDVRTRDNPGRGKAEERKWRLSEHIQLTEGGDSKTSSDFFLNGHAQMLDAVFHV
jgi:hypothetical protein